MRRHYHGVYKHIIKPKGLFKGKKIISKYDGDLKIELNLEDWIQQQIYFLGYFDSRGIGFLKNQLKEGDVFIDIGANIGAFALIASKCVGPSGRVVAFEPVPYVFEYLSANVLRNQLTNITLEPKAVYSKSEKILLHVSGLGNTGMTSIFSHEEKIGDVIKVQSVAFDDYLINQGIEKVDMIKLDIEGAEFEALQGMKESLRKFRPVLFIEINNEVMERGWVSKEQLLTFLRDLGYEQYAIDTKGNVNKTEKTSDVEYFNYAFLQGKGTTGSS